MERNPSAPNYEGLDIVSGTLTQGDGRAIAPKFTQRTSADLEAKETLCAGEEIAERQGKSGRDDDDDSDDLAKKRKKKKPKGKGGGSDGAPLRLS